MVFSMGSIGSSISDGWQFTVSGLVVATAWGPEGQIESIVISVPGELEYRVTDDGLGKELLNLGGKFIEAKVAFDDGEQGEPVTVLEYRTISALAES